MEVFISSTHAPLYIDHGAIWNAILKQQQVVCHSSFYRLFYPWFTERAIPLMLSR